MIKTHDKPSAFPVLTAWLAATAKDFERLNDVNITQYELYLTEGMDESASWRSEDLRTVEEAKFIKTAREFANHESVIELACIHLDNGDEFYIRPDEAYEGPTLEPGWRDWVEICRGTHTPVTEAVSTDA